MLLFTKEVIELLEIVLEKPKHLNTNVSNMLHMEQILYNIILNLIKKDNHLRQIAKDLDVNHMTVKRALDTLVKENVLDVREEGRNNVFSFKKNLRARKYTYNAENYKMIMLFRSYPELEPIISEILNESKSSLVILFGSFAKFSSGKDSDIDIYIDTNNIKEKKEIELVNSKISTKIGKFDLNSLLIKEIINDHVILKGVELFYEKTKFFD